MIGNRIKELREKLGLKQDDLAKKIGVSPSAIGMYERDLREANDEIKLKMCELFDCSMDYLVGNSNYKNEDEFFRSRIEETKQFVKFELPPEFSEDVIDDFIEKIEKEPKDIFENELKSFLTKYPENIRGKIENYIRFMYDYSKNLGLQEAINVDKINIGLSTKDYNPPTKEQQEKIEEFAKFVLKDNLKKKEEK